MLIIVYWLCILHANKNIHRLLYNQHKDTLHLSELLIYNFLFIFELN
jgi:hypothetical protein